LTAVRFRPNRPLPAPAEDEQGSHNPCSRDRKPPLGGFTGASKSARRWLRQIGNNTTTAEIMSAKGLYAADYGKPLRSSHTKFQPFDYRLGLSIGRTSMTK